MRDKISARTHSTKQSVTITDEELLKLTSSLFTEQKVSSDLPPEPLQGNQTAVTPAWLQQTAPPLQCYQNEASFPRKATDRMTKTTPMLWKNPKRKNSRIPEFQDTPSTDSFTYSRSRSLPRYHHISTCQMQIIHLKPKRDWPNASMTPHELAEWREQPARSTLGTAEVPLLPLRCHSFLLMPEEKAEQTHPKPWPHGTKGLIPHISDIFSGKMMMWEGRKLLWTAQEDLPVTHKGFFTCLTFREDTGGGCQQLPDSDKHN